MFEKNLRWIFLYNQRLYQKLIKHDYIESPFQFVESKNGDVNLIYRDIPIHSNEDPQEEAIKIYNKLPKSDNETVHLILGLGLGYVLKRFVLNSKDRIIIYEPNLDILKITLEAVDLFDELDPGKVVIANSDEELRYFYGKFCADREEITFSCLDSYHNMHPEIVDKLTFEVDALNDMNKKLREDPNYKLQGERQEVKSVSEVELRHRQRYMFSSFFADCYPKFYNKKISIADIGCGIGYGSNILASMIYPDKLSSINSFDISEHAVNWAKTHFQHEKIKFHVQNCMPDELIKNEVFMNTNFDLITSFEFLEHIELPESRKVLDLLLRKSQVLITSFPIANLNKWHKIVFGINEIEEYYQTAVDNCPVKKRIINRFAQNGSYYLMVIESV